MAKIGDKFAMDIAREYMNEFIGKITDVEIMNNLRRKTNLSYRTLESMFNEVLKEKHEESKVKIIEKTEIQRIKTGDEYYKGKRRLKFRFDDSNLYRKVADVV